MKYTHSAGKIQMNTNGKAGNMNLRKEQAFCRGKGIPGFLKI